MWKRWNYLGKGSQKTLMGFGALMLVSLLYQLAISQTYEAWQMNRQLHSQLTQQGSSNGMDIQLQRKRSFYQDALKHYQVSTDDLAGHSWERVSSLALSVGLTVGFKDHSVVLTDSLLQRRKAVLRPYEIKGNYPKVVVWLDSMSRQQQMGWIYQLRIRKAQSELTGKDSTSQGLVVSVTTAAIK